MNWFAFVLFFLLSTVSFLEVESWGDATKSGPKVKPKEQLHVGLIAPHTNFGKREYLRAINSAVNGLNKIRGQKLSFLSNYEFTVSNVHFDMMSLTPSPTGEFYSQILSNTSHGPFFTNLSAILNTLCKEFLHANVSSILYMMNYEQYGRSTASAQYFLQLAGYLGIPVISWNADNSGLERRASQSTMQLQLAPSIEHQSAAMLAILERYKWHQFSVVTSQIAGHDDFVQAVRERVAAVQVILLKLTKKKYFPFLLQNLIRITSNSPFSTPSSWHVRVIYLNWSIVRHAWCFCTLRRKKPRIF